MPLRRSTISLPMPRLLPMTILLMATLLALKSGHLIFPATAETAAAVVSPAKPAPQAPPSLPPAVAAKGASSQAQGETRQSADPIVPTAPGEPPVSESERALLVDLRKRRVLLDARESAIATREVTFQAVEKRLAARLEELSALQQRLEDLERHRKERDEGSWRGLVKLYESMKPRDAALIFNELDSSVLVPVLDRMKESKAAPIMSAMQPDRARQVTIELASERKNANAAPAASADRVPPS
jgi:flagellar motility protein MotE (MotC chaperone)